MKGSRGTCNRCGKWSTDLRPFSYKKKDYGNICRKCRNSITAPDRYLSELFKRMEEMGEENG